MVSNWPTFRWLVWIVLISTLGVVAQQKMLKQKAESAGININPVPVVRAMTSREIWARSETMIPDGMTRDQIKRERTKAIMMGRIKPGQGN